MGKAARHYGQTLERFLAEVEQIVHGTTLGTNILITERGAKVGMITTKGFRDSVEMRRGIKNLRGSMFDIFIEPYKPLVPRYRRLGVEERTLYNGKVLTALNEDELRAVTRQLHGRRLHRHRDLLSALLRQWRERIEGQAHRRGDGPRYLRDNLA